jgi:DNA-binding transcriptional MocR family regulator
MCDPSDNAVVVSQSVLAALLECSTDTVQRAVRDLVAGGWIEVVRIGKGKEAAYVLNDRVAWSKSRKDLVISRFRATVVADHSDQDKTLLSNGPLRRFPTLFPGEQQLPTGPGESPPSQPSIPGLEPDLPAVNATEKRGQRRLIE